MMFIPIGTGLVKTTGAAGLGTSLAAFLKQNQIVTANLHLSAALSNPSKATQNIVPYRDWP